MVTVHRAYGFRFVIFPNDDGPPHVHAFGHGGEAKIVLHDGPDAVQLEWATGIGRSDLRRLIAEVRREHTRLVAVWRKIHA